MLRVENIHHNGHMLGVREGSIHTLHYRLPNSLDAVNLWFTNVYEACVGEHFHFYLGAHHVAEMSIHDPDLVRELRRLPKGAAKL